MDNRHATGNSLSMAAKKRIDLVVQERGLFASREAARTAIMDGAVIVDGTKVTKPGALVRDDAEITITNAWKELPKYVSRGGLKLEKAIAEFSVDVTEKVCLDVGASTGGFTDCLLQHGAKLVYAIDVGYGQLDWSLRTNPRVVVHERVNARKLIPSDLYNESSAERASIAVMDLSFISIQKVMPAIVQCLQEESRVIALIKPQFEAGPKQVGKGGVVRHPEVHAQVLETVLMEMSKLNLELMNLTFSPIKGPAGNIEFLAQWRITRTASEPNIDLVSKVVTRAHEDLSSGPGMGGTND